MGTTRPAWALRALRALALLYHVARRLSGRPRRSTGCLHPSVFSSAPLLPATSKGHSIRGGQQKLAHDAPDRRGAAALRPAGLAAEALREALQRLAVPAREVHYVTG